MSFTFFYPKTSIVVLLFVILGSTTTLAQDSLKTKLISGNSFNVLVPVGKLSEVYDHGLGVYANFDYRISKTFSARFDLGWNDLTGDEEEYINSAGQVLTYHPNISVWEFSAGMKAQVKLFYTELRGGYFTGIKKWGVIPALGVRYKKFDLQGNYNIAGTKEWWAFRLAYYWGQ